MVNPPRVNDLYRCKATQLLFRVMHAGFYKVEAVHESPIPSWSWVGDRDDFLIDFMFVSGDAIRHNRLQNL